MDAEIQAKDGNRPTHECLIQDLYGRKDCHPWTLDSGIHAGMTEFRAKMRIAGDWHKTPSDLCDLQ
jgi:hypothetical protein